ncbi:radical SAM protein [Desulfurococcus amylolyticus]|uniref:radical SAM protein n=1 Tax=Desulfurococcus amylolyticus TaxID=94694 RepID=UPI000A036373|nr:radical SAM protein [Desulfurococcus amylolyticus]
MSKMPRSLQVEVTNNCNFTCIMCVRRTWKDEKYGLLSPRLFSKIVNEIDDALERLALYGFGEPLLHPELPAFIKEYREKHGSSTHILVVTNGSLATPELVDKLFRNGLNELVFSIDSNDLVKLNKIRVGVSQYSLTLFQHLAESVKIASKYDGKISIATVLMRENLAELPSLVDKAVELGISELTISHLVTYTSTLADQILYSLSSEYPVRLIEDIGLEKWEKISHLAFRETVESQYSSQELKWHTIYNEIYNKAVEKGYSLNIFNIRQALERKNILEETIRILDEAKAKGKERGLIINAPGVYADALKRTCPYIDKDYAYIRYDGLVSPCMDLAYEHPLFINNHYKIIRRVIFGNLWREHLRDIWLKPEYVKFRNTRKEFSKNIPWCSDCNLSTFNCWYVDENIFDCYGNEVGCSECIYAAGLAKCII